jgi:LPPG:FO 2-phospho-L-lactate transferase
MLRGLAAVVGQPAVTAVINTGDDIVLHGLHVSPDIDTVTYTLAGVASKETGWGLAGESWATMEALRAFEGLTEHNEGAEGTALDKLGGPDRANLTWFALGDRDMATHLFRTGRLAAGATLSEVTAEAARRWGVQARLLPMTDVRVETRVTVELPADGRSGLCEIGFQEYFVGLRHDVRVGGVRFVGAEVAVPAPGVLEAIEHASLLVICPSNPIVSIGPVLAVPGITEAVSRRREHTVAVSPIIAGKALKGPADRMLVELGYEPSAVGVAHLWAPLAGTLVVDDADAGLAPRIEALGMRCVVAPTVMSGLEESANLARTVLAAAGSPGVPAWPAPPGNRRP